MSCEENPFTDNSASFMGAARVFSEKNSVPNTFKPFTNISAIFVEEAVKRFCVQK
jgi:hypothetical protein